MMSRVERITPINKLIFKTTMAKSNTCDYSGAYSLVEGTITVVGACAVNAGIATDRNNKQAIFKNCAPFTDHMSKKIKKKYSNTSR